MLAYLEGWQVGQEHEGLPDQFSEGTLASRIGTVKTVIWAMLG